MPQTICVVLCYKCNIYQCQIVKKAKKWVCVMCGEKQSLKRTFGTGSGKECREYVQKLNSTLTENDTEIGIESEDTRLENEQPERPEEQVSLFQRKSKWDKYLEKTDDTDGDSAAE